MAAGRSKDEFLAFLDWVAAKGLLPLNTAHARKAVANKILAALEADELTDITALDIDSVMVRFTNKFGKRYTPDSLRTYRSRFESSIADFKAYCDDPVGFRPAGRARKKQLGNGEERSSPTVATRRKPVSKPVASSPTSHVGDTSPPAPGNVVPVQIRADLTIRIGPLPYDLTVAEARRIANVVMALAMPETE